MSLAVAVALGSLTLPSDGARAATADRRVSAPAVGLAHPVTQSGTAIGNGRAIGSNPAAGGPTPTTDAPTATAGPPVAQAPAGTVERTPQASAAAPTVAGLDFAPIGTAAVCDGASGTWQVTWSLRPIQLSITVTAVRDPVNNVSATVMGSNFGWMPGGVVNENVQLPGTATVAALVATVTLPDGSSQVENRTVSLGAPCTVQPGTSECDPAREQIDLSASAGRALAVVTGSCTGGTIALFSDMTDPRGNYHGYSFGHTDTVFPAGTRQVLAVDVPPTCQWTALAAYGTPAEKDLTGGTGFCNDDSMRVSDRCPQSLVLTLTNAADAALPTTFTIIPDGTTNGEIYRQVAPGQSVTVVIAPATVRVSVYDWQQYLGEATWSRTDARCGQPLAPPSSARPGHLTG